MEYQRLGNSGLQVSRIILGCMSFGSSKWAPWVLPSEESLPLLKAAYDLGITTWDTADVYSNGASETLIGDFLQTYSPTTPRLRANLTIMTKCFGAVDETDIANRVDIPRPGEWVNQTGLSRKHILDAVDNSVRRLGTYIDVLQIHRLDHTVEPEEIMAALHEVVQSGKVRYIGASSMYAHEFATLQFTATLNHYTKFISMQNFYNLLYREEEREMIPFCKKTGVGLIPWSPIARGVLARPYPTNSDAQSQSKRAGSDKMLANAFQQKMGKREGEADREITDRVEKVAKDRGVPMAVVAISWSLSKGCCPIVGVSSVKRMKEALTALTLRLTEEEVKFLEEPYMPKAIFGH